MNRINEFNLEPGPYKDHEGTIVVAVEILTHTFNGVSNQLEGVEPLVIVRNLADSIEVHKRFGYPISIFKQKFHKA